MSDLNPNAALVLTGGGARGAYQVGVLRALAKILPGTENPFPIISGCSAGAINAGFLAARASDWDDATLHLEKLWKQLTLNQIYNTDSLSMTSIAFSWIRRILFGTFMRKKNHANFLLDTEPLRRLLREEMNFVAIQKNFNDGSLAGLSFSALDYSSGSTVSFFHDACMHEPWLRSGRKGVRTDLREEHVMASSSIPVFFPPININSVYYGDGSLRQIAPFSPAIHMGADRILAISIRYEKTDPKKIEPEHAPSLAEIGGQLMHSLFLDSLDSDLERLKRINESVERFPDGFTKNIPVMVLHPSKSLDQLLPNLLERFPPALRFLLRGMGVSSGQGNALMSYLAFLPECIEPLIALGYEDTLLKKEEILSFMLRKL